MINDLKTALKESSAVLSKILNVEEKNILASIEGIAQNASKDDAINQLLSALDRKPGKEIVMFLNAIMTPHKKK